MSDQKIFKPEDFEKPKSSKPSKVPKIALGVLAVALLGAGGYFLLGRSNGEAREEQPTAQVVAGDSAAVQKDTISTAAATQDEAQAAATPEEGNGLQTSGDMPTDEKAAAPAPKTRQSATKKPAAVAVTGNVDEMALDVIRGDYGNGQVRKGRLGAEYQTIQDKVNEMYRNGLVR